MPSINYVKIGLVALVLCGIWYSGYHYAHSDFLVYKAEQDRLATQRKAENEAHAREDELKVKGLKDELATKTLLLKRYYSSVGVRSSSGVAVLSGQGPTIGTPTRPTYEVLSGQCAETTLKYMLLQKYERERLNLPQPQGE